MPIDPESPERKLWQKYIYGPQEQARNMQAGPTQWNFDPSMTGPPAAPNVHYTGNVQPMDLGWQKDVMNYRQDVNDYLADPMTYLSVPGAYDPMALGGEPLPVPVAPATPTIDAYIASGGIYGELATAIKQGAGPAAAVDGAVQAGKMTPDQAQNAIYAANDMFTEKVEYDQKVPAYQQELATYNSSGGMDGSKYQELGLTPPWVEYSRSELNPTIVDTRRGLGNARSAYQDYLQRDKQQFRGDVKDWRQDAKAAYVEHTADPFLDITPKAPEDPGRPLTGAPQWASTPQRTDAQSEQMKALAAADAVYKALEQKREEDYASKYIFGNQESPTGRYEPLPVPQQLQDYQRYQENPGALGPQVHAQQNYQQWVQGGNAPAPRPQYQPSPEQLYAQEGLRQSRNEHGLNQTFTAGLQAAARANGASPFNDQMAARQAFMQYLMGG